VSQKKYATEFILNITIMTWR